MSTQFAYCALYCPLTIKCILTQVSKVNNPEDLMKLLNISKSSVYRLVDKRSYHL